LRKVESYKYALSEPITVGCPLKALQKLFKEMPKYSHATTNSFKSSWESWNQSSSFIYADGNLSTLTIVQEDYTHFLQIFAILSGNEQVIMECSSNWKECLVGLLYFTHPMATSISLPKMLGKFLHHFKTDPLIDKIRIAIINRDASLILRYCSQFDVYNFDIKHLGG
jgi:hypothetical protein